MLRGMSGLLFPKGKTKKQLTARRRREIAKMDKLFQQRVSSGNCVACRKWHEQLTLHHLRRRRVLECRWDIKNAIPLCVFCHNFLHMTTTALLFERYPHLEQVIESASSKSEGTPDDTYFQYLQDED